MEEKKRVNIKRELTAISELVIRVVFVAIILVLINELFIELSIWISMSIILLITIPTIFLHLAYSYKDKDKTIIMTDNDIYLEIKDQRIDLSSSKKIVIKGSVALTRKAVPMLISPNYYEIIFISDEFGELTVSSLFDIKIKDEIFKRFGPDLIEYNYFFLY